MHEEVTRVSFITHMRGMRSLRPPIPRALHRFSTHTSIRPMSSQREDSIPHELRTAAEPRQNRLYPVRLAHVEQVNTSVRLLRFTIPGKNNVCPCRSVSYRTMSLVFKLLRLFVMPELECFFHAIDAMIGCAFRQHIFRYLSALSISCLCH